MFEDDKQYNTDKVRYYENQYPRQGQTVIVRCLSCQENGCYVELLEYQGKRGMVPINQYTQSMKKHIHRAMRVGRVEAVKVVRVDANKGYIDLSKSKINADEEEAGRDKFAKARAVHSIMIHVADALKRDIIELYNQIIWPLYKKDENVHPKDILLKYFMTNKQDKTAEIGIEDQQIKKAISTEIKRRFKKPSLKSIAKFKVSVRTFDGITLLKEILSSGVQASKKKGYQISVVIIGAPQYLCSVETATKQQGEQALNAALIKIEEETKAKNGVYDLKEKPRVVGDSGFKIQDLINEELQANNKQMVENSDDSDMGDADY